ncbi:glycosyltransferase [Pedobacter sp. HMF7647]|uniref:Glycosyltransferase n=1 Tax=Hufsiella arboris TaxID=2695275 RepID=A0A7K1YEJ0_9SPHI|nr:glycosyltransferase [Hufsiella arboris]MXV52820.1 glycosyltransferase [Hufsiella arboris]
MKKCYFITDQRYISSNNAEGGVKLCTVEFLNLFKVGYDVEVIEVKFRKDFAFKITAKLGVDAYNLYSEKEFLAKIEKIQVLEPTVFAFNMTQTMNLTKIVKQRFGNLAKVIMLSHGNDSGDFVHNFTRFNSSQPLLKRITSSYKLGNLLKKEASYKKDYIDLVLTVSPVEDAIEKWLNAKQTMMIPRVITATTIKHTPKRGRIGFIGDMTHHPNYYAIEAIANKLQQENIAVDFVLIGGGGETLPVKYPFIRYLGFLEEDDLRAEVGTWSFFLNLAFYYSRGVSTKLGKALGLGLPIISTAIGTRGYEWKEGQILVGNNPSEIVELIKSEAFDQQKIDEAIRQTELIAKSSPTHSQILNKLTPLIDSL